MLESNKVDKKGLYVFLQSKHIKTRQITQKKIKE